MPGSCSQFLFSVSTFVLGQGWCHRDAPLEGGWLGCGSVPAPSAKNTLLSCLGGDHRPGQALSPLLRGTWAGSSEEGSLGPLYSAQPGSAPHPTL